MKCTEGQMFDLPNLKAFVDDTIKFCPTVGVYHKIGSIFRKDENVGYQHRMI